jgi:hypothetical protein
VRVQLTGGSSHSGVIVIEKTTSGHRMLDYLNRFSQRFLQLTTDEGVVLINRDCIVHVEQAA